MLRYLFRRWSVCQRRRLPDGHVALLFFVIDAAAASSCCLPMPARR